MRTTLNIDDDLLKKVRELTGLKSKTEMVERGLRILVEDAARRRLIALAGKIPDAKVAPRRRPPDFRNR